MAIKFDGKIFTDPKGVELSIQDAMEWSDYARAHGIRNLISPGLMGVNGERILELLETAVNILGVPVEITSFWRTPVLNAKVGGKVSPPSAHMDLRAVDFQPIGLPVDDAYHTLAATSDAVLDFDQLIIEHSHTGARWIHLSVPHAGTRARRMAFALEKQLITDRQVAG